jgi:DNA polymerase III epsilon subunit-like protein
MGNVHDQQLHPGEEMIATIFDTETTGLLQNRTIKNSSLPEVIDFYAARVDLDASLSSPIPVILGEFETLIRPSRALPDKPNPGDKKTTTQITGLTNEMLASAPLFAEVAGEIVAIIESSPFAIAHNVSYDHEMIEIEMERCGRKVRWPRLLCTVEATTYLKGKRLSMAALHDYLFSQPFPDAHRAKPDTQALIRCCVELYRRGVL